MSHSEIAGSKLAHSSPTLIAACHVLHRLLAPRHPPDALAFLDPTSGNSTPPSQGGSAGTPPRARTARTKKDPRECKLPAAGLIKASTLQKAYPCFLPPCPKTERPKKGHGSACQRPSDTTAPGARSSQMPRTGSSSPPYDVRKSIPATIHAPAGAAMVDGRMGSFRERPDRQGPPQATSTFLPAHTPGRMATKEGLVGLGRLERPTSRLSGVRSNQLSYRPESHPGPRGPEPLRLAAERSWSCDPSVLCSRRDVQTATPALMVPDRHSRRSGEMHNGTSRDTFRKEVIQPQVPLRLPCYDFTPVADPTVDGCLRIAAVSPPA